MTCRIPYGADLDYSIPDTERLGREENVEGTGFGIGVGGPPDVVRGRQLKDPFAAPGLALVRGHWDWEKDARRKEWA
jgi:hypothetical protein